MAAPAAEPAPAAAEAPAAAAPGGDIHLDLLEVTKLAQTQHGLRHSGSGGGEHYHNDYMRYRQYCARRIHRLRKGVKLTQGKRDYRKKVPDVSKVRESGDARFVELALMLVERAWAYAMDLKEQETEENLRPGVHHRRRLAKAARYADELVALCREVADARTQLEAEAYASWVHGNNHMERGELVVALAKFKHSKAVFEQLGKVSDVEQQSLCQDRVHQIDPSIRLIQYDLDKLKRQGFEFSEADQAELMALQAEAEGDELLQRRLDDILAEGRKREAESMSSVTWQGRRVPIKNEKVRVAIIEAQQVAQRVEGKAAAETSGDRLAELYSGVLASYEDALQLVRADIREADTNLVKKHAIESLEQLQSYVVYRKLHHTDARNRAMAASLIEQYTQQQRGEQTVQTKKVKPDDLVHLYERMLQNMDSMRETAGADAAVPAEDAARRQSYVVTRLFYLGESYRAIDKFAEAFVLFGRAVQLAEPAAKSFRRLEPAAEADAAALDALREQAKAQQYVVQVGDLQSRSAGAAKAKKAEQQQQQQQGKKNRTLAQRADEYEAGPAAQQHRLLDMPPQYVAVPGKPVFFDLAFNSVAFPDVSHRVVAKKQAKPAAAKPKPKPQQQQPKPKQQQQQQQQQQAGKGEEEKGGGGGWFGFLRGS